MCWEDERAGVSALDDHLGPGPDPVRHSGEPGGLGVDTRQLWIAGAIFIGSVIWIVVLSLIALAMSAWVKWKVAAGALILGVFFVGAGFGAAINAVMRTKYGIADQSDQVIATIWAKLFRHRTPRHGIALCWTRGWRWRRPARSACGC